MGSLGMAYGYFWMSMVGRSSDVECRIPICMCYSNTEREGIAAPTMIQPKYNKKCSAVTEGKKTFNVVK